MPSIPPASADFTGRDEELKELQAKFASGTNIIGLRGIGGVGKTALAFKLAESLRERYPDGHIMVDMRGGSDSPATPSDAMASVIHAYHSEEKIPKSEADIRTLYLKVLEGKRALILLDNALDDKQVLNLIPPRTCSLIITSRRTIKIPGLFRKDLDVLKPEEALELLLNVWCSTSGSEKTSEIDPAWPEITGLCGYLPLALRAAASYLANSEDVLLTDYADELKDERTRLNTIGEQGVELGVDASFNLSFKRLDVKTQQIFLNASVFPADFDSQAEEIICQDEGHRHLSELLRWSLIEYQRPEAEKEGRYHLHDLVRIFAAGRMEKEADEIGKIAILQRHAEHYKNVLSSINTLYTKGRNDMLIGLTKFDLEKANIEAGWAWAKKNLEENDAAASLCNAYPDRPYLLCLRMPPRDQIDWMETALVAARYLNDKRMEGIHLGNLGSAYGILGEMRKAIKYYEQALAIARNIKDRWNEGAWLCNLGNIYTTLGDARKAIECYEQALPIVCEVEHKKGEGSALNNLGLLCADLGEMNTAIEYYQHALTTYHEIEDRGGESAVLGNIGLLYVKMGKPSNAIKYYIQQLSIARKIGDKRGEGNALGSIGNAYIGLNKLGKAVECLGQALAIHREFGDMEAEGIGLWGLAICHKKLNKLEQAIKELKQALEIFEKIESHYAKQVSKHLSQWQGDEYPK